ncbi:Aldehyde dehydrogenase [Aphelenchoides fujianensis]|nr:Aldehyde dehydrogenase [Aphelenchoides fujianensis]
MTKPEFIESLSRPPFKARYDNFIGGQWVAPTDGRYFDNASPIHGKKICEIARSQAIDVERALDAAHAAKAAWGKMSPADRSRILLRIADRMEENLEEGSISEIDHDTIAYHFHEPLGVVGQIIPWNFPLLMACWKLAPALAAGNCVVLKPAEQTPASIMVWAELIGDLLPAGVLNIVNGFGIEAGKPLASSPRIAKIAFTGETSTGRLIMQYASQNLIPVTLELGGKSPNIFFDDVAREDDDYSRQGPGRLHHESIYEKFMERALKRVNAVVQGSPLDPDDHDRRPGVRGTAEQDPRLHGHRPQRKAPSC